MSESSIAFLAGVIVGTTLQVLGRWLDRWKSK